MIPCRTLAAAMSHLILTTSCRTDLNHSASRKIEHRMKERPRCPPTLLGRGNGLAAVPIAVWDGVDVETEAWRMEEGQLEIKCRRGNCQADREDKNFKMDRLQPEIQKDREFITQQAAKQKGKLEHEAIYSAVQLVGAAWRDTLAETILKCFQKAGFSKSPGMKVIPTISLRIWCLTYHLKDVSTGMTGTRGTPWPNSGPSTLVSASTLVTPTSPTTQPQMDSDFSG
ncbi:Hypp3508 [Branchiostoma lanceolatum]|uniref:Hypp3508 protein n=1 Tax=Branchiostoma lanceolatum TaxID=7740 RepID=A0A8K0A545_BRALA|nr:Hypp3508 [Branchiostoma lanceolatum]